MVWAVNDLLLLASGTVGLSLNDGTVHDGVDSLFRQDVVRCELVDGMDGEHVGIGVEQGAESAKDGAIHPMAILPWSAHRLSPRPNARLQQQASGAKRRVGAGLAGGRVGGCKGRDKRPRLLQSDVSRRVLALRV